MLWKNRRQSSNVQDRRGISPGGAAVGGGIGTVIFVIIAMLLGADPQALLEQLPQGGPSAGQGQAPGQQVPLDPREEEMKQFVSVVLADTEDVWKHLFISMGLEYQYPTLVLFSGQVSSACGHASAAVGPFYCPGDQHVYLDLSFLDELDRKFDATGDFAEAYVIAHEVGHHVQHQLGLTDQVHSQRGRISDDQYNELSVRLELQADFFAGVWAHHAQHSLGVLEPGDIDEAIKAASAIGDDRLQMEQQGYVVPDSFTHGTSEQRMRWFMKGFESGDPGLGDTFSIPYGEL